MSEPYPEPDLSLSRDARHSGYDPYIEDVPSNPPAGGAVVQTLGPPPDAVPPVLSSLNPATIVSGAPPVPITVTGSGFLPASRVWADEEGQVTTYVSDTELVYQAQADMPGTQTITVHDAAPSNAIELTVT